jgi:hypothetical protein
MDFPEKLATFGTQYTGLRQKKQQTQHRKLNRCAARTQPRRST